MTQKVFRSPSGAMFVLSFDTRGELEHDGSSFSPDGQHLYPVEFWNDTVGMPFKLPRDVLVTERDLARSEPAVLGEEVLTYAGEQFSFDPAGTDLQALPYPELRWPRYFGRRPSDGRVFCVTSFVYREVNQPVAYSGALDSMRPLKILRTTGFYDYYPMHETTEGIIGQSSPEKSLLWGDEECEPLDPNTFIMRETRAGLTICPR